MVKIIVEGKDDSEFFKKFIHHLIKNNEINKINPAAAIMHMGGKAKLLTEQPPAKAGGLVLRTKVSDTGRIDPFMGQF